MSDDFRVLWCQTTYENGVTSENVRVHDASPVGRLFEHPACDRVTIYYSGGRVPPWNEIEKTYWREKPEVDPRDEADFEHPDERAEREMLDREDMEDYRNDQG